MIKFTLEDEIKEVKREIAMRKRVYPKWSGGVITPTRERQIAVMEAVLKRLESLEEPLSEAQLSMFD